MLAFRVHEGTLGACATKRRNSFPLRIHFAVAISLRQFPYGNRLIAFAEVPASRRARMGRAVTDQAPCGAAASVSRSVAVSRWPCRPNRRRTTTKNIGTKKMARMVADSMPPRTPGRWRAAARTRARRDRQRQDAEDERERGHQDRPQAQRAPLRSPPRRAPYPSPSSPRRIRRSGSRSSPAGRSW